MGQGDHYPWSLLSPLAWGELASVEGASRARRARVERASSATPRGGVCLLASSVDARRGLRASSPRPARLFFWRRRQQSCERATNAAAACEFWRSPAPVDRDATCQVTALEVAPRFDGSVNDSAPSHQITGLPGRLSYGTEGAIWRCASDRTQTELRCALGSDLESTNIL